MCGILFSTCSCEINILEIINRGPNDNCKYKTNNITLIGCVLHQQGYKINKQPLNIDNSFLLWNGENYKVSSENDGITLLKSINSLSDFEALSEFSKVNGPYATVFIKNKNSVYFGRDVLGRRSLLCGLNNEGDITLISSTIVDGCHHVVKFLELPALGMFKSSVEDRILLESIVLYPYDFYTNSFVISELERVGLSKIRISSDILKTNYQITNFEIPVESVNDDNISMVIEILLDKLEASVRKRVTHLHRQCAECVSIHGINDTTNNSCHHSKIAILFSGGIDSAVIACLVDKILPDTESIDLLNVSFCTENKKSYDSPDRKSGLICLKELMLINPNRKWNFVEIDIMPDELRNMRQTRIAKLIQPCDTVLDDSIGCALWFAARGSGTLNKEKTEYVSPARVVLTGIGADELMAGYCRHRRVFDREGYVSLQEELDMEMRRISSRNMGRDDRVISSHSKEGRFPFLDDEVVSFLMSLPITLKCDLTKDRGLGEKMILRLLARDYLKLSSTWSNHKRAIQFGSQIAKVDRGKGYEKCEKLRIDHYS